jgi:drug/metabolite transporter (DMT)-like permease
MRTAASALLLLPLWWLAEGGRALRAARWGRGSLVGFLSLGLASVFTILAQERTGAVTVAVVAATSPVVGIALEVLEGRRRLSLRIGLGVALSLAGGLVACLGLEGSVALGVGALAAFAAVVCYTWGSALTISALPGMTDLGRAALTVAGSALLGGLLVALWSGGGGGAPDWAALGWREAGALLIFGVGAIGVSQLLWIMGVSRIGIGLASFHLNAAPFYVMLILWSLGRPWDWMQAAGAGIVALAVLVAQERR